MSEEVDKYMSRANQDIQWCEDRHSLKVYIAGLLEIIDGLQQENKQLKDNWNKLKEWVFGEKMTFYKGTDGTTMIRYNDLCNKIQELEKSDSNE